MQTVAWHPKGSNRRLAAVPLSKDRKAPLTREEWVRLLGDRVQAMVEADEDARGTVEALLVEPGVLSRSDLPDRTKEWGPALVDLLSVWVQEESQTWPARPPFKSSLRPLESPNEESLGAWISRVRSAQPSPES